MDAGRHAGGAGLHRGGNGVDVAYVFEEPGEIAIHDDRWLTYPWGVNGGTPGARGRKWIERAPRNGMAGTRQVLPSKCHDVKVFPGDVLHFVTWGGGGWGDPLERDPDLVALEVRRGLVTAEGARRYGVVLDGDGGVDAGATTALRDAAKPRSAAELAEALGVSRVTARRYAEHLVETGRARRGNRYAGTGRPEVTYAWAQRTTS